MSVDGDPLPLASGGTGRQIRKSRNAPRRALALLALHALIAGHITHYVLTRRTLSPVEPSEAMYTLELGQVNAGFIFLLAALAATLLFGRFVCGWGCHIVALQDLCGWMMKKVGIRPRPFRSRLLLWAPAVLAFYMFFWPSLKRLAGFAPASFPGFSNHLTTDSFWATFPGPLYAVLTFAVCGFAAVYFLGAKGFCTYGCPYGALFGGLDRFSPAGILVNDDCEQCGHCTATCTSNVVVHEEVRLYGRVVDPGCMKCMDCVSVCPKGALRYGFSTPSFLARRRPAERPAPRATPGRAMELGMAAVFLAATLAFRGLYDGPPLLMSMALGGISAYGALKLAQLVRERTVRAQNLTLKAAGEWTRTGGVFAAATVVWLLFAAHSGWMQAERAFGARALEKTEAQRADALSGAYRDLSYSAAHDRAVEAAHRHFSRASRWGLADVVEVELGLAWAHLLRDEPERALERLRGALSISPTSASLHDHVIDFLIARGRIQEAADALSAKLASTEAGAQDHFELAGMLVGGARFDEAVDHYRQAAELAPDSAETRYNLGGLLRRLGQTEQATAELERAAELAPADAETRIELGLAYAALGRGDEAVASLRLAIELDPESPESRLHLPELIRRIEQGARDF